MARSGSTAASTPIMPSARADPIRICSDGCSSAIKRPGTDAGSLIRPRASAAARLTAGSGSSRAAKSSFHTPKRSGDAQLAGSGCPHLGVVALQGSQNAHHVRRVALQTRSRHGLGVEWLAWRDHQPRCLLRLGERRSGQRLPRGAAIHCDIESRQHWRRRGCCPRRGPPQRRARPVPTGSARSAVTLTIWPAARPRPSQAGCQVRPASELL